MKIYPKAHLAEVLKAVSDLPKEHEGRISWESEALDRASFEILYNLNFKTPVEDYIKDGAVWHALNECARAKSFAAPFFIGKLRAYLEDLLSKKGRSFTAVMQINAEIGARLPKKIASVGGSVDIQTSLPRACLKVISGLKGYERSRLNLQDGFVYAIAKVSSANDRSALDIAYRRMKYALGVLNLAIRGMGLASGLVCRTRRLARYSQPRRSSSSIRRRANLATGKRKTIIRRPGNKTSGCGKRSRRRTLRPSPNMSHPTCRASILRNA
jgi:hypothetical protein